MAFLVSLIPGPIKYQRALLDGAPAAWFRTLVDDLHEESEEQQRPALELMQRDRERVAEPGRAEQERPHQKTRNANVTSPRAARFTTRAPQAHDQERQQRDVPPLARRHPYLPGQEHHPDDAEVGGVEDVLAVDCGRRTCWRS